MTGRLDKELKLTVLIVIICGLKLLVLGFLGVRKLNLYLEAEQEKLMEFLEGVTV